MSRSSRSQLLEEEVELLIRHFGPHRVRAVVRKFAADEEPEVRPRKRIVNGRNTAQPTIPEMLQLIRMSEPEKYRLLDDFFARLKEREILPESQDIRQFAQLIGIKDINGKSRKDMIPRLMRFLLDRETEKLRTDIRRADNISEEQRQQGFSVLTDKLLGQR